MTQFSALRSRTKFIITLRNLLATNKAVLFGASHHAHHQKRRVVANWGTVKVAQYVIQELKQMSHQLSFIFQEEHTDVVHE